jgi:hypothetical protein
MQPLEQQLLAFVVDHADGDARGPAWSDVLGNFWQGPDSPDCGAALVTLVHVGLLEETEHRVGDVPHSRWTPTKAGLERHAYWTRPQPVGPRSRLSPLAV